MLSIRPFLVLYCSLLVIVSAEFKLPDCQGSTKPYFDADDLEKFKVGNRTASWDQLLKMKMDSIIRRSFRRTIMSIVRVNHFTWLVNIMNDSVNSEIWSKQMAILLKCTPSKRLMGICWRRTEFRTVRNWKMRRAKRFPFYWRTLYSTMRMLGFFVVHTNHWVS